MNGNSSVSKWKKNSKKNKYPKVIGEYQSQPVTLNKGKFGLWVKFDFHKINVNDLDDKNLTLDTFIALIKEREKNVKWKGRDEVFIYAIIEGPYGLYIKVHNTKSYDKDKHFKLPKQINFETMEDDALLSELESYVEFKLNE
jgi:topoisomerase IA-like protein